MCENHASQLGNMSYRKGKNGICDVQSNLSSYAGCSKVVSILFWPVLMWWLL